jgi:predicted transcriptional regulator
VQEANEGVKDIIKAVLEGQAPMTVSEIMTHSMELAALSNQKVASLVRQMVEAGVLVRTEEKRKAYFSLAQG